MYKQGMKNHLRMLRSYAKGKITLITCTYLSLENVKEKLSMTIEKTIGFFTNLFNCMIKNLLKHGLWGEIKKFAYPHTFR